MQCSLAKTSPRSFSQSLSANVNHVYFGKEEDRVMAFTDLVCKYFNRPVVQICVNCFTTDGSIFLQWIQWLLPDL